jgi:hypothetical protein
MDKYRLRLRALQSSQRQQTPPRGRYEITLGAEDTTHQLSGNCRRQRPRWMEALHRILEKLILRVHFDNAPVFYGTCLL